MKLPAGIGKGRRAGCLQEGKFKQKKFEEKSG